jgi:hypothetical protein
MNTAFSACVLQTFSPLLCVCFCSALFVTMRRGTGSILFVALVFLSQAVWFTNSQECDSECVTHCNNDGTCVCAIYNDTIGNRPFNG